MSLTEADRGKYIAYALEAEIRSRIRSRSRYREERLALSERDPLERYNDRQLRYLFCIRRDGLRAFGIEKARVETHYRAVMRDLEAREWAESVRTGQYVELPLADPGDHFVGMPA